jgi:hypothetical protein
VPQVGVQIQVVVQSLRSRLPVDAHPLLFFNIFGLGD